jgi:predicted alpha/beta-fold hydrolase
VNPQALTPACLGLPPFQPRWPWWGADLQTLRDTIRPLQLPPERPTPLTVALGGGDALLALLDVPPRPRGLVLVVPGLGGEAAGSGPRRLALALRQAGLATLRLNLRGAGAGRPLAGGTYAARCNRDLLPVLARARALAAELAGSGPPLPLAAAGLSLGGTILLHACQAEAEAADRPAEGVLALACLSSPLDLADCSAAIGRPRNAFYERWLVRRLLQTTLADRRGLDEAERRRLQGPRAPRTIRGFDAQITAPRWGYAGVEQYYAEASPLALLRRRGRGPAILLLQAADDPWVPAGPAAALAGELRSSSVPNAGAIGAVQPPPLQVLLTRGGGHCGFHGVGDPPLASWSDRVIAAWLAQRLA